jgi:hypothetical protein
MTTAFDTAIIDMLNDPNVGDDATYTPTGGTAVATRVFFQKEDGAVLGMKGYLIRIEGLTSIFSSAKPGETVTVLGTTYKIKEPPHESDDGMSIIELSVD